MVHISPATEKNQTSQSSDSTRPCSGWLEKLQGCQKTTQILERYCNSMVCTFDVLECYDMVGNGGGRGKGTTAASRRGANCSGVTVTEIVARGEQ